MFSCFSLSPFSITYQVDHSLTHNFGRLFIAEVAIILGIGVAVAHVLLLQNVVFHFHSLTISYYTDGTMDFSTDVTSLVRGLGIVTMLILGFGLAMGTAMGLTTKYRVTGGNKSTYEEALMSSGFVNITNSPNGTMYQLTETGKRFLRDYAFLIRGAHHLGTASQTIQNESR
jgi:hypothetical protein